MANQIRITPEQMRGRAGEYRTQADTVNDVISKMDVLLANLQQEWEGSASESYAQRYTDLRKGFVAAEDLIREIAAALDATANIVEETDTSIANQFKA